jgi:hypothetical protein
VKKPAKAPAAAAAGDAPADEKKAEGDAKPAGDKPAEAAPASPSDAPPADPGAGSGSGSAGKKSKKEKAAAAAAAAAAPGGDAPSAPDAPPPPAPAEKPAKKEKAPKADAAAAAAKGTASINAGPTIPLTFDGQPFGKAPGAQKIPVTKDSGTIEFGDATTQFRVTADYTVSGKELVLKIKSDPWAIVSVDQVSKGKTPVSDIKIGETLVTVEFKKPGQDSGLALRLSFSGK